MSSIPSKIDKIKFMPQRSVSISDESQNFWNEFKLTRWQTALILGTPTLVIAGLAFWYWRRLKKRPINDSNGNVGLKTTKGTNSVKKQNSSDVNKVQEIPVENKEEYLILKDKGNDFFRAQKYGEALDYYKKAIESVPEDNHEVLSALFQNRAAVYEKLDDYAQAEKECTLALKHKPKYVKALLRRGKAYQKLGFLEQALEDITAVCILEQFKVESSIVLADGLLKQIGLEESEKIIKTKKPLKPSDHSVISFLRSFFNDPITLIWDGRNSSILEELKNNTDDNTIGGFLGAVRKLRENNFDQIIELCTDEINTNPNSKYLLESYLLRGTMKLLWNYKSECVEDFQKIADSNTDNDLLKASALIKLACYKALVDETDYPDYFDKAEKLTSQNVDVYHHRGQVYLTKGLVNDAIQQIEKGANVAPQFPLAVSSMLYLKYRIHFQMEDHLGVQEIVKEFESTLLKFPKSSDVNSLYAQILMELRRIEDAMKYFDKALELDPSNTSVLVHKVMAQYSDSNDHEKVIKALREILKKDDKSEFLYETIGSLELQNGNLEKATEALGKALEFAKSNHEILMLTSLKKAAEVQVRIKNNLGIEASLGIGGMGVGF